MNGVVYRIGTDTPDYTAEDKTGEGARLTGGRWNRKGLPAIYAASSRALAALETIVHLSSDGLPLNRYLVQMTIPEAHWDAAERAERAELIGWDAQPHGKVSLDFGDSWLREKRSLLLLVPSVIVPEERNAIFNPQHPDINKIEFKKLSKWTYDHRLSR